VHQKGCQISDNLFVLNAVKVQVESARSNPLADVGPLTKEEKANGTIGTNTRGGNTTYTLRRLARDAPELGLKC
jgi:hypothetical protein